jgi:hypothetical protein
MRVPNRHSRCIWCDKRLIDASYQPAADVNFGPRPRSEEHIIPRNLFGKIVTYDLCKACNSTFGEFYDHALVNDGRMIGAASRIGIPLEVLKPTFRGVQRSPSGKTVNVTYQNSEFRISPEGSTDRFAFGVTNGKISDRDFSNAKAYLVAKITRKRSGWSKETINTLVGNLMDRVRQEPQKVHLDLTLGEGWKPTNLESAVTVAWQYHPWETDWCLAKIVFELAHVCWPDEYFVYCRSVSEFFREFMRRREGDREIGQGTGAFQFTALNETPKREHVITCVLNPQYQRWNFTFFGTASWSFETVLTPLQGVPANGYELVVKNPFGQSNSDATWVLTKHPL